MDQMKRKHSAIGRLALYAALATGLGWTHADSGPSVRQDLPAGVSAQTVARGDTIFHGSGFCYNCHGSDGGGMAQLGGNLTDATWRHNDGSFEGLVQVINAGVSAERSSSGVPMPPRGAARLSGDEVRAVAAYVWLLSRGGT